MLCSFKVGKWLKVVLICSFKCRSPQCARGQTQNAAVPEVRFTFQNHIYIRNNANETQTGAAGQTRQSVDRQQRPRRKSRKGDFSGVSGRTSWIREKAAVAKTYCFAR